MNFSPASGSHLDICNSQLIQQRQYLRAWDNRVESNMPGCGHPCGSSDEFVRAIGNACINLQRRCCGGCDCCTCSDQMVHDNVHVNYYDRHPFRSVYLWGLVPRTCCGPPVVFLYQPKCCCGTIDLTPCFGASLRTADDNCFGLRTWLCCGPPCYVSKSKGWIRGVPAAADFNAFMVPLKNAVSTYQQYHQIPIEERAIFENVIETGNEVQKV